MKSDIRTKREETGAGEDPDLKIMIGDDLKIVTADDDEEDEGDFKEQVGWKSGHDRKSDASWLFQIRGGEPRSERVVVVIRACRCEDKA